MSVWVSLIGIHAVLTELPSLEGHAKVLMAQPILRQTSPIAGKITSKPTLHLKKSFGKVSGQKSS